MEAVKVGKRGAIIVPAKLRKRYGIDEGTLVTAEARQEGVLIRLAVVVPVEDRIEGILVLSPASYLKGRQARH
jgi:AbrB family looped-hinge helix DNA binding protein